LRPQDLGFGHLFESVRDAIIVANATTQRIVLWNQAATDIFGYPAAEALKLRVEDLVPERLKDQHRAGIARYVETQRGPYVDSREPLELPALRMDGQEIYIEMSLTSIGSAENAVGSERYVAALVRDVTRRKQTEEEVRRLNEDLEKRVAERTEQLKVALANLEERERGLQESQQRYRSFIEQSTEGIWRLELE
jgi:PAS domain S-box-containing protein